MKYKEICNTFQLAEVFIYILFYFFQSIPIIIFH